jgi:TfoX/Sxy family transcriptional regulator of competence genes
VAFDGELAQRVRELLAERADVTERKMFGGLAFLVDGNMAVGITGNDLMVRVGKEGLDDALAQPHAREMDFTGRPSTTMGYVQPAGTANDPDLGAWVDRAVTFAQTLPAK